MSAATPSDRVVGLARSGLLIRSYCVSLNVFFLILLGMVALEQWPEWGLSSGPGTLLDALPTVAFSVSVLDGAGN